MPEKMLINVPLTGLATSDEEVLSSTFSQDSKEYKWMKNAGTTGLVAAGCCLEVITSVTANMGKRVTNPDATLTATGSLLLAAGVPMTAMGPSGSDTGDHGWIQIRGYRKVSYMQSSEGTSVTFGGVSIATSVQPATAPWGIPTLAVGDSANTAYPYSRKIVFVEDKSATTGPATAGSAIVDIQCR